MSWDVFVQDLPIGIGSVAEVPPDFVPAQIGLRADISQRIRALYPEIVVQNESWLSLDIDACALEVNLGSSEAMFGFAFHVYGGADAPTVVARILKELGLRALDPQSETGLFEPSLALGSFASWKSYRDRVIDSSN